MLGHRFSGLVAIQPGHKLLTSGVYGVIRHPSYLGLLVNSLGWALAFRSGVGVLLTVLLIPPLLRAFVLKNGCCVRSSAANTISTAPARRGSFPRSIEAGSCRRTILPPPGLGADG